jgi:hypothetical protein
MTLETHDARAAEWTDAAPFERLVLTRLLAELKTHRRWSQGWRRASKAIRAHKETMYRWYGPESVRALDDDDVRQLQQYHQVDLFAGVRAEPSAAGAARRHRPRFQWPSAATQTSRTS